MLIVVSILLCVLVSLAGFFYRRFMLHFERILEQYEQFLLSFNETPRTKIVKKYVPPMEPLYEDDGSQNTLNHTSVFFERRQVSVNIQKHTSDPFTVIPEMNSEHTQ